MRSFFLLHDIAHLDEDFFAVKLYAILHVLLFIIDASFICMGDMKTKRTVVRRRTVKAANSPEPSGPVDNFYNSMSSGPSCGHEACGVSCNVRYAGPTSSISNHHILHAARGVSHIWSASIITGLAIVITGALAFNAAQASSDTRNTAGQNKVEQNLGREIVRMNQRLDEMQKMLQSMKDQCFNDSASDAEVGTKTP